MNLRRHFGARTSGALVFALLVAGCSDDGPGDVSATGGAAAQPGTGGGQPTGGTGMGGSSQPTGGVGTGGASQPTGGVGTGGSSQPTGGTGGSTGGQTGTGGGAQASCSNVVPCGGDVIGTWSASSSCLALSGELDLSGLGIGCASATLTSGTLQVTGTWTANADGTYSDTTTWSGTEEFTLAPACLNISGTTTTCEGVSGPLMGVGYYQGLTYTSVTCAAAAAGGCTCTGVIGLTQTASGTYTLTPAGSVVTTSAGAEFTYCIEGTTMTMTPSKWATTTTTTTTGTVLLQKQ